jgi:hypothetical protein
MAGTSPAMTNISGIGGSANPLRLPIDFEPDSRGSSPAKKIYLVEV